MVGSDLSPGFLKVLDRVAASRKKIGEQYDSGGPVGDSLAPGVNDRGLR